MPYSFKLAPEYAVKCPECGNDMPESNGNHPCDECMRKRPAVVAWAERLKQFPIQPRLACLCEQGNCQCHHPPIFNRY